MARRLKEGKDQILWKDRKRWLGMPLTTTKYWVAENRLYISKGLFSTETDEMLIYRIQDIKMKRTFGQKLAGVGTITLYTNDKSSPIVELKNIKQCDSVRRFLSRIVEQERAEKGLVGQEVFRSLNMPIGTAPEPANDGKKQ